jgi:nicotinamide-nucleotide amidase
MAVPSRGVTGGPGDRKTPPRAFIVTIGDELTKGEIADTNAAFIADRLSGRGIAVAAILSLPDDPAVSARMIERLLKEDGIFIFSGGLGGTRDDVTRTIVGDVLGKRFFIDTEGERRLESWYRQRGRPFLESDRAQAACPEGGVLLDNPVGLAFGFHVKTGPGGGRHVFALPGVPREMKAMFDSGVLPALDAEGLRAEKRVETLLFAGIGEYVLDREIASIIDRYRGVRWGTRSGCDTVKAVVESDGRALEPCIADIEAGLAASFVGRGDATLEEALGKLLREKGLTLSAAESCTGGYLSKTVTDVPGSSGYFLGGVVSYSNGSKTRFLDVRESTLQEHGAVSGETAREMCRGSLQRFSSDLAAAVTGIAGPEGGSEGKPVGTVFICVMGKGLEPVTEKNAFPGDRETVRQRSVNRALFMLIRYVRERYGK